MAATTTSSDLTLTATCVCGNIKLLLTGVPVGTYMCHCLRCRKISGGTSNMQVKYPRAQVTITSEKKPMHAVSWFDHSHDDPTTAPEPHSTWCPQCGCNILSRWNDLVLVQYGLIDVEDDENGQKALDGLVEGAEKAWTPAVELWCKRKPVWAKDWVVEGAKCLNEQEGHFQS